MLATHETYTQRQIFRNGLGVSSLQVSDDGVLVQRVNHAGKLGGGGGNEACAAEARHSAGFGRTRFAMSSPTDDLSSFTCCVVPVMWRVEKASGMSSKNRFGSGTVASR